MKPKILIVEDEFIIALDLQQKLHSLGYDAPEIAGTGDDAIKIAHRIQPNIILMDIVLAGNKDGIETSEEINKTLDIPIIYTTSYSDRKIIDRAKLTKPYAYITKPYNERDLVSAIEITIGRYSMQKVILQNERKFRRIFENAADCLFVLDQEGKILDCNSRAHSDLGYSREELLNLSLNAICTFDQNAIKDFLAKSLKNEKALTIETDFIYKNKERFNYEIRLGVFETEGQNQFLAMARNTNERKKAEKERQSMLMQLAHSGKLATLGTMSASLIHELKNPLTSVLGFTDLILTKEKLPERLMDRLTIIKTAALQMKSFIDHLKVYVHLDTFEDMEPIDLNQSVSRSLQLMKMQTADIDINVESDANLPQVFGNSSQIESILQNFIINSCDAFLEKPKISKNIFIRTYTKEDFVFLEFEDTAGGIPREHVEKVFQPFFTTKSPDKGTGLGLSIVSYILEHHKARVELNVKPGIGSCFILKFPIHSSFQYAELEAHKVVTTKILEGKKPKLILIDDDPNFTNFLEALLGDKFEVESFNDPEKALLEINRADLDLLVTDLNLPKITGQEIIRHVQKIGRYIPIIVITGMHINSKEKVYNNIRVFEKPIDEVDNFVTALLGSLGKEKKTE